MSFASSRLTRSALVAFLAFGLASDVLAGTGFKGSSSDMGRRIRKAERAADKLTAEYRTSLRLARRWLPRGDEQYLWEEMTALEGALDRCEKAFESGDTVKLHWRLRSALALGRRVGRTLDEVPHSGPVERLWRELDDRLDDLSDERNYLRQRNARFHDDLEPESQDPAAGFSRNEADRARRSLHEAEDLANRVKSHLRWLPSNTSFIGELELAELRDLGNDLERELDELVHFHQRFGGLGMHALVPALLEDRDRMAELLRRREEADALARDFRLLSKGLDELALAYGYELD
ncbi:MAG: hypothetical protein AAF533_10690 [Acidobacteriota bacterium]